MVSSAFNLKSVQIWTFYVFLIQKVMADTTVAKEIEEYIQHKLSEQYNQQFCEKEIQIGIRKNGEPAKYRFDAVSQNEEIIAGIKSHAGRTVRGKFPRAKVGMCYAEIYFLSRTKAKEKLLILTSKEFYDLFIKDSDGKIPEDTKIEYLELPERLQEKWKKSIEAGRREMQGPRERTIRKIQRKFIK